MANNAMPQYEEPRGGFCVHRIRVISTAIFSAAAVSLVGFAAPMTSAAQPVIFHQARLGVAKGSTTATWSSSNWSGYAETGHYSSVSASWTVPSVTAGAGGRGGFLGRSRSAWYSAVWTGIDGFNDSNLIQTGTEQDYYNGSAHYNAWWEILPAAETPISNPVSPGDSISANIVQTSTKVTGKSGTEYDWVITLKDLTKGWTFTTTQAYAGAGTSAEWIVEAPEVNGSIASIADYSFPAQSAAAGDFNTADVATTIGGPLTGANLNYTNDAGTLVQNGAQVSTPGQPDTAATAFNSNYGATAPPAPTS